MIRFEDVSVQYNDAPSPVLSGVSLHIPEGELCLVAGSTGCGKSTLLGAINGLVPHFTGGTLGGRVTVAGLDTRTHPPRELAEVVGVVVQDPVLGFVTDTVEDELAYGMEQLSIPPATMRKRVEEVLDLLALADIRHRPLRALSGGQQQRVAIGSVLTAHPQVLVLDEPTSALDPAAAEDVLAALVRLVHDLGITVVMAEHRLERVVEYADLVVTIGADRSVTIGAPAAQMETSVVAPPVVRLGQAMDWQPLPLSVRDARRRAAPLRERLAGIDTPSPRARADSAPPAVLARGVTVRHGHVLAVDHVSLEIASGAVTALMGRNGSGKSSLLWAIVGGGTRSEGSVLIGPDRVDPRTAEPAVGRRLVGLVPQSPADLLYLTRVGDECDTADAGSERPAGTCRALLDRLVTGIADDAHPRDLSEGQRLALALAVQLCGDPSVVLLDEPTRGLDEHAKHRLAALVRDLADAGRAVVIATHDVEVVASVADRVIVLADGQVVADGPTREIVVSSPVFAPQVAKVMRPVPLLDVADLVAALAADEARR